MPNKLYSLLPQSGSVEEIYLGLNDFEGENQGFSETMILTFFGSAIVRVVETYFMKGIPDPPEVVAEQMGMFLDRNL
jgi:hypothetical protein